MIFEQNSNYFLIACNKSIYLDDSSLQGNPDHAIKKNPGKSKSNNFSIMFLSSETILFCL